MTEKPLTERLVLEDTQPETPFFLLTQDGCPRCDRLEAMLERPLHGKYEHVITTVHRQAQPERFGTLAAAYSVRSTPVIIHAESGAVLANVESLGAVSAFLGQSETTVS